MLKRIPPKAKVTTGILTFSQLRRWTIRAKHRKGIFWWGCFHFLFHFKSLLPLQTEEKNMNTCLSWRNGHYLADVAGFRGVKKMNQKSTHTLTNSNFWVVFDEIGWHLHPDRYPLLYRWLTLGSTLLKKKNASWNRICGALTKYYSTFTITAIKKTKTDSQSATWHCLVFLVCWRIYWQDLHGGIKNTYSCIDVGMIELCKFVNKQ